MGSYRPPSPSDGVGVHRLPPSSLQRTNGRKLSVLDTSVHFLS